MAKKIKISSTLGQKIKTNMPKNFDILNHSGGGSATNLNPTLIN